MTTSPEVEPQPAATPEEAAAMLRGKGLRLSTTRRLLLEALFSAEGPVAAERVARTLGLDAASVHRNFEMLERQGLLRHVHLGHGPGLYTLLGRGGHEYLYCDRCGAVRALEPTALAPVRRQIQDHYGYRVRFDHFAIVGLCAACANQGHAAPATPANLREHSHGDYVHTHSSARGGAHRHSR